MSNLFSDEKDLLDSIEKTRDLIEICKDFIKSAEKRIKQYEALIKQYPSDPDYKSCLQEYEEWLVNEVEALKQYKETLTENREMYESYYGKNESFH
jgi:DNA repair ATPase RecN